MSKQTRTSLSSLPTNKKTIRKTVNFYGKPLKAVIEDRLRSWCSEEGCDVPLVEVLDTAMDENSSYSKLMRSVASTNYGAFGTVYDITQKKDNIKTMHFQDFRMGIQFLRVLQKLFNQFSSITVLTLQNCSLDADAILHIASNLNCIQDLNLDDNPCPEQIYDCLLTSENMLKHLSLKFCEIDAIGARRLAEGLEFRFPKVQQLLSLNLSSNHIDSDGAKSLAKALRSNRDLVSLSLTDNWIGDEGAISLAGVLKKFELTEQEINLRMERQLQVLITKKNLMEELYMQGSLSSNAAETKSEIIKGNKLSRMNSSGRAGSKSDKIKRGRRTLPTNVAKEISDKIIAAEEKAEPMINPDSYPLLSDSYYENNTLFSPGNFRLAHFSISYNKVTDIGIKCFLDALVYQHEVIPHESDLGIFKCNVEGNQIFLNNQYVAEINTLTSLKEVSSTLTEQGTEL